jgi:DNA-binding NarL/FixJ family response regulator
MNRVESVSKDQQAIQSIVLADDDRDDHDFFKAALQEIAPTQKLHVVTDGVQLLDLLQHYVPDLIFLDLDMPCKNGLECLKEIRNNSTLYNLPVVVFSSTSRPANITTAYEMGGNLFFIKPSNFGELVNAIRSILSMDWSDPNSVKEKYLIENSYAPFSMEKPGET